MNAHACSALAPVEALEVDVLVDHVTDSPCLAPPAVRRCFHR